MPSSIDRYIFRTVFGAFLLILLSLTGIIWITHALREIDLITNQGQTILVFLGITGLLIPILAQVIAPIAFVIAVIYAIDKLNGDAELVVMNADGTRARSLPIGAVYPYTATWSPDASTILYVARQVDQGTEHRTGGR